MRRKWAVQMAATPVRIKKSLWRMLSFGTRRPELLDSVPIAWAVSHTRVRPD